MPLMPYAPCTRSVRVQLEQPAREFRGRLRVQRHRHHVHSHQQHRRREVHHNLRIRGAARPDDEHAGLDFRITGTFCAQSDEKALQIFAIDHVVPRVGVLPRPTQAESACFGTTREATASLKVSATAPADSRRHSPRYWSDRTAIEVITTPSVTTRTRWPVTTKT